MEIKNPVQEKLAALEAMRQHQAAQGMMGVPERRNAMLENNNGSKLPRSDKDNFKHCCRLNETVSHSLMRPSAVSRRLCYLERR